MNKYCLTAVLTVGTIIYTTVPSWAQLRMYNPLSLPSNNEVEDILSDKDIPTGEGGFARDYYVYLEENDQVVIDLISDDFDPIVSLIAADGSKIGENDDGPDGTNNSLLFLRITESGTYIVRVRAFGETGGGNFKLRLTRLRPVDNPE
ncbi:MAG: peptidase [Gloeocapsa sp. DLM2.Bin57]|nr:MAG: peptidase [Gloeocapsa sp. DLM2.Bin57]